MASFHLLHRPFARFSVGLLLALGLASPPAVARSAAGDTICGWKPIPAPGNSLSLFPASAPPWIDPSAPCSCCVSGAKYGLGVFGTPPDSGAVAFYSLGTAELPLFGETWLLDPTQIVATAFLPPDPDSPTFAATCWVVDDCLTIPAQPGLIGLLVHIQAAAPDGPDWALSNRLELLVGTEF